VRLVAVPLERDQRPYGAVVVTMEMGATRRVRHEVRLTTLAFAPVAILILTVLIDLLARRLVFTPLASVRLTMSKATGGDLGARVPPQRAGEIGAVARGLNAMLERVADFNAALRQAVDRATEQLTERNRQLAESAQRLFVTRRELAKSEQLAVTGQMAARVAHQIGTPLNLISGYVQMIQEGLPKDATAAVRLRTVQEQIGRVTTVVRGLLDQARSPVLSKQPVPAEELVSRTCELARPALDSAHIDLHLSVEPGLPCLQVDAGQMEQVFLNLVTNSIDAMPEGGMLHVLARETAGAVEFTVADTGMGISSEDIGSVFDPLFTTKRPGKGTGLGLAIVRDVVAAHGGSVTLTSEAGRGTTAVIRIPIAATPVEAAGG
jgi:two-component system NtrC family sensor kinase